MTQATRVGFTGSRGERLAGRIDRPPGGAAGAWALFAHCFTCSKDLRAAHHITRELNAHGIGVLRFDFTGLGESEGDFADTNFSSNVEDLVAAAAFLAEREAPPDLLIGHSLGGSAVLQAAKHLPAARAVVTLAAPFSPEHVANLFGDREAEIRARGEATVTLAGRSFTIRKQFLDDLEARSMDATIAGLGRALLVLHSPIDAIVGIDNAARIFQAARHPRSFVSLDDADHLLTREADARYAARVIAAWVGRYVEPAPSDAPAEPRLESRVVARNAGPGFRTDLMAGHHGLVADEPVRLGGTDLGPTPYDLLAAALAACSSLTVRMYADRKGWPLDTVEVGVTHDRVHAEDQAHCEDRPARVDRLRQEVLIDGPLDRAQRARLLEIAGRCPVHRTLDAGVRIDTRPAGAGA